MLRSVRIRLCCQREGKLETAFDNPAHGLVSAVEAFMPLLQEKCLTFDDHCFDSVQVRWSHALGAGEADRPKPEFAFSVAGGNVQVRRFRRLRIEK